MFSFFHTKTNIYFELIKIQILAYQLLLHIHHIPLSNYMVQVMSWKQNAKAKEKSQKDKQRRMQQAKKKNANHETTRHHKS